MPFDFSLPGPGQPISRMWCSARSDVQNEQMEDFVLLRSTGLPTYQLSVVVDDIDMPLLT